MLQIVLIAILLWSVPLTAPQQPKSPFEQADQAYRARNIPEAEKLYRAAMQAARDAGDELGTARARFGIGLVEALKGEYEAAAADYEQVLPVYLRLASPMGIASVYNSMAIANARLGNMERALELYKESLRWSEKSGDRESVARALFNLGNAYIRLSDYRQALRVLHESMDLSEAAGVSIGIAYATNSIGNVHRGQGNLELALDFYSKSLAIKEKIGNYAEIIDTLLNIAAVQMEMGNNDLARASLDRAIRLNRPEDRITRAATLHRYGSLLLMTGDAAGAIVRLQESLDLSTETGERYITAANMVQMGRAYFDLKEFAKAAGIAEKAVVLATEIQALPQLAAAYDVLGLASGAMNDAGKAEKSFQQSIATLEERQLLIAGGEESQEMFGERQTEVFDHVIAFLVSQKKFEEAFAFAERKKSRVLLSVLGKERMNVAHAMTEAEVQRERGLQSKLSFINSELQRVRRQPGPVNQVASLEAKLNSARLELIAFETALYASHPELQAKRSEAPPISLPETRTLMTDARTALLEYIVTEVDTFLFVIRYEGDATNLAPRLRVYSLGIGAKKLSDMTKHFRAQLATRDPEFRTAARALHQLLIMPAAADLERMQTLIISPNGPLWQLPFQALTDGSERYLVESYTVSFAPSLTVLQKMARIADDGSRPPRLFAIGNPGGTLPHAEREVRALASIYGPDQSRTFTKLDAREETVKAETPRYDVVHFATHGVFDDRHPMYSYLLLSNPANDQSDDGRLEAREIMKMNLQSDIVILSACETALGRTDSGEGLIGMTWALFIAGSPTTVASQWKVDSASTTEIMIQFHRGLNAGAGKARALRQSMLSVMQRPEYRHPFYWAGFVMVGESN